METGRRVAVRHALVFAAALRHEEVGDLFTARQLVALTTFSDLVQEAREHVIRDAVTAGLPDDGKHSADGGTGAPPTQTPWRCTWHLRGSQDGRLQDHAVLLGCPRRRHWSATFARQALPMTWDYAEGNPFGGQTGEDALSQLDEYRVEMLQRVFAQA